MVRFLLPKADTSNLYLDRNLLIVARCALLASEWKQQDQQYSKLHTKFENALKAELKVRFDRYALLRTWNFQTPKSCAFDEEPLGVPGADVPAAVEQHVTKNHFAPEDFEALIVQAAARNDTMRQVIALLREPPLPGQIAIPYLGDLFIYEQVLGIVAKDKIAINASGRWWHKEAGESSSEALTRLKQRVSLSGLSMFAVQLGDTSQVGSVGVAATSTITLKPSPITPVTSPAPVVIAPFSPIVDTAAPLAPTEGAQSQPVIYKSLGAKTGVNLLGDIEKWALPDAQKTTVAVLTLNGLSVKDLRDLCVKLPPRLQAELQLVVPPDGGLPK